MAMDAGGQGDQERGGPSTFPRHPTVMGDPSRDSPISPIATVFVDYSQSCRELGAKLAEFARSLSDARLLAYVVEQR